MIKREKILISHENITCINFDPILTGILLKKGSQLITILFLYIARARLQNLTLEDSREISKDKHKSFQRLIDSKCPLDKMIEANINRDPEGNLDVEVVISR